MSYHIIIISVIYSAPFTKCALQKVSQMLKHKKTQKSCSGAGRVSDVSYKAGLL